MATIINWSLFPAAHIANEYGYTSDEATDLIYTFCDVLAKVCYSVAVLTGNFFVLDHLEEIKALEQEEIITNALETARRVNGANQLLEVRRCKLDPNLKAPPGFKGST